MVERWSPSEQRILQSLDSAVFSSRAGAALAPICERVLTTLARGPREIEAWEPVPLDLYGAALPQEIRSSWVFVLRRGVTTGAERHPNSIQRMMSWSGHGDFQVHDGERWKSHHLVSDPGAPLEERWISIPPETWHQGVVGEQDWLVVSFHTVAAHELIEERSDPAPIPIPSTRSTRAAASTSRWRSPNPVAGTVARRARPLDEVIAYGVLATAASDSPLGVSIRREPASFLTICSSENRLLLIAPPPPE